MMTFTEQQTLQLQSSQSLRLYSPLAILLLYWQPVESGLFWGWHGKQRLPLPLHPSPESSSARGWDKEKEKEYFFSSPLTTIYPSGFPAYTSTRGTRWAVQNKYYNQSNTRHIAIEGMLKCSWLPVLSCGIRIPRLFHVVLFPWLTHVS